MAEIIREVGKGKMTAQAARALLRTGLGLYDADIDEILGVKTSEFSAQDDEANDDDLVIDLFSACGAPRDEYAIMRSRRFEDSDKAPLEQEQAEFTFMRFARDVISQLQADILDLINKDKLITPEALAEVLDAPLDDVQAALDRLIEVGALEVSGTDEQPVRTLTKPVRELQQGVKANTIGFKVLYSYEGPEDDRNRPFCARMMDLKRLYTRAEIERISNKLGYSVWDRCGGFNCRHEWVSNIVKKK